MSSIFNVSNESESSGFKRGSNNEKVAVEQALTKLFPTSSHKIQDHIVKSGKFMAKSSHERYGAEWVAREIVQNFIDHNVGKNKGTLNNVQFTEIKNNDNTSTFIIEGNWPINNSTGLTEDFSDGKADNSAGGNGIGLKQVALMLMRDVPKNNKEPQGFGVEEFKIHGNGWVYEYDLVKKQDLKKANKNFDFSSSWLVAHENRARASNTCKYEIKTNNKELIQALREMQDMGVHDTNPYLENPSYKSKSNSKLKATIKWLEPNQKGRFFLNGQVMKTAMSSKPKDFTWDTLSGLSLALTHEYEITLDRAEVSSYDIRKFVLDIASEMKTKDIIKQLNLSKGIWTKEGVSKIWENDSGAGAVDALVKELSFRIYCDEYKKEDFEKHFGAHYYETSAVSEAEIKELRSKGISIVPKDFERIGAKPADILVDRTNEIRESNISAKSSYDFRKATKNGATVNALYPNKTESQEEFFTSFINFIHKHDAKIVDSSNNRTKIKLNVSEKVKQLFDNPLISNNPDSKDQQFILQLRGFIAEGIKNNYLSENDLLIANQDTVYKLGLKRDPITDSHQLILKSFDENSNVFRQSIGSNELVLEFSAKVMDFSKALDIKLEDTQNESIITSSKKKNKVNSIKNLPWQFLAPGGLAIGIIIGGIFADFDVKNLMESNTNDIPKSPEDISTQIQIDLNNESLSKFKKTNKIPSIKDKDQISSKIDDFVGLYNSANINGLKYERHHSHDHNNHQTPHIHVVENLDFKEKTNSEREKLEILTSYISNALNIDINDESILVYTGNGALGLNFNKCESIGLHRELLKNSFESVLSVLIHEIAHCGSNEGHDEDFIHATESLHTALIEVNNNLLNKMNDGKTLSSKEQAFLDLRQAYLNLD
ncbi:MAG: hypothetical protein HRT47_07535 [Candidatus Caenarcaniphilales bacterium]|nr:hypothetical protein [Candidatus Caenarcaniphilales bacterium]